MTNALDFFNRKNLLDYMSDWFGDLKMIPLNFTNSPKVNVKETDKAYEIEIANPGFSKDETKIEVKDGIIYVSMTSENKDEDENSKYEKDGNGCYGIDSTKWLCKPKEVHDRREWPIGRTEPSGCLRGETGGLLQQLRSAQSTTHPAVERHDSSGQ